MSSLKSYIVSLYVPQIHMKILQFQKQKQQKSPVRSNQAP